MFQGNCFRYMFAVAMIVIISVSLGFPAFAANYQTVNADALMQVISKDKSVKFVFLFTSWCPYCKKGYEKVLDLAQKYDHKKLLVIPVSLDENASDLNDFLAKYAKPNIISVNYLLLGGQPEIQKLTKLGINFVGSIPYIALLDDNNKIIVEGRFDEKYVDAMISLLVKNK